jgi:acyl-[acyl carrier protein]--UDP-N-acetylglucosamine O-acyltransferase
MIGSGSVIKRDIPDYGLAWGNPARLHGFACPCGSKLTKKSEHNDIIMASCPDCARTVQITAKLWKQSI